MIKLIDNKVYLNEEDYKAISGIWGAFRGQIDYCCELLKYGNEHYEKLKLESSRIYNAIVDSNIDFNDYSKIFNIVFIDKNYEVVDE